MSKSMNNVNKNMIEMLYDFLIMSDIYVFNQCSKYLSKIIIETHTKKYILKKTLAKNKLMSSKQTYQDIAEFIYSLNKSKLNHNFELYYSFKNNKWELDYYNQYTLIEAQILYMCAFLKLRIPYKMLQHRTHEILLLLKILTNDNKKTPELTFDQFDKETNIIGFHDGMYNLNNNYFRISFPSDYISKTTKYNYPKTYSNKKDDLLRFLQDIQPDETMRNYLLEQTAKCLNNKKNRVLIFIGEHAGIDTYSRLIDHAFGDYCTIINNFPFARDGYYNRFFNEQDLNKKIIIVAEPLNYEMEYNYNKLFMDYIDIRKFCVPYRIDVKKTCTTILRCDFKPEINEINKKAKKRTYFINFPTKFVDNPVEQNEKKKKIEILNEYKLWISDFMLLLIEIYKKKYG